MYKINIYTSTIIIIYIFFKLYLYIDFLSTGLKSNKKQKKIIITKYILYLNYINNIFFFVWSRSSIGRVWSYCF